MADDRLRELERRWRESGAVVDEAEYLLERVRANKIGQDRLILAAYLGNPAAQRATDFRISGPRHLGELAQSLFKQNDETLMRVALALIENGEGKKGQRLPRRAKTAISSGRNIINAWVQCPCAQHRTNAANWFEAMHSGALRGNEDLTIDVASIRLFVAYDACKILGGLYYASATSSETRESVLRDMLRMANGGPGNTPTEMIKPDKLLNMIGASLIPWLLA